MDNIVYSHYYYLVRETKRPTYLDFYDLTDKDMEYPEIYLEQTIRYKNKWFFVTSKTKYFRTEKEQQEAPRVYIKYLYKKPVSFLTRSF